MTRTMPARLFVAGMLMALWLAALDATVVGTAMPFIAEQLAGRSHYAWVFMAYMITSTLASPLMGRLSDTFGRKRVLHAALLTFILASLGCSLAGHLLTLSTWRLLQGLGAGGIVALVLTLLGDRFPPHQRGRMQALASAVWSVASIVGPLVGGVIVDLWMWQGIFLINLPLGLALLVVLALTWPATPAVREPSSPRLDPVGIATFSLATFSLLLALQWLPDQRTLGTGLGLVAVGLGWLWYRSERHRPDPFLDPGWVFHRVHGPTMGVSFLSGVVMFGPIVYLPLLFHDHFGTGATASGLILVPISLGWTSGAALGGRLSERLRFRHAVVAGTWVQFLGLLLLAAMPARWGRVFFYLFAYILGLGMGAIGVALVTGVQYQFRPQERGGITGMVLFLRSLVATLGIGLTQMGMSVLPGAHGVATAGFRILLVPAVLNLWLGLRTFPLHSIVEGAAVPKADPL